MIIYTDSNDKVICYKCNKPKMKNFDHITTHIDENQIQFHFSVRNNASYYYFYFENQWYMTNMVQESGLDLFYYLYEKGLSLHSKLQEVQL